jgi:hypothetical protein
MSMGAARIEQGTKTETAMTLTMTQGQKRGKGETREADVPYQYTVRLPSGAHADITEITKDGISRWRILKITDGVPGDWSIDGYATPEEALAALQKDYPEERPTHGAPSSAQKRTGRAIPPEPPHGRRSRAEQIHSRNHAIAEGAG